MKKCVEKCAPVCGHCEDTRVLNVETPRASFCDMNCYRAYLRDDLTPTLTQLTKKGKEPMFDYHMECLAAIVAAGKGWMTAKEMYQDIHSNLNKADQSELDLRRAELEIPTYLWDGKETVNDMLLLMKKKKKNKSLRRKIAQCVLDRDWRIYELFKTKLLEDWVELLDMAGSDFEAKETAELMKYFHSMLESCEIAFF